LTGATQDRIQTVVALDDFVFSNNGADPIQLIDPVGLTFADLGNAPNYRYIAGIYNRVVGAARRETNEVEIGWSADGDIAEWNPVTDPSAGSTPLLDSPSDLSDFITGLFAVQNALIVLRENSVWVGNKQASQTDPFYFATAIPGVGCDSPHSAVAIPGGIAWLDRKSGSVYTYMLGGGFEPIGRPIEKSIIANIDDPQGIFASYNPIENEYSICIPTIGSKYVNVWTYNFRGKSWVQHEYYALTSIDDIELAEAGLTIDQLGDVPIDSLTGTIDELSPSNPNVSTRTLGRDDGTIAVEDRNTTVDAAHTDYPTGISYTTRLESKTFVMPSFDIHVSRIIFEYIARLGGSFDLLYSKDNGKTWHTAKTVTIKELDAPQLLMYQQPIRCKRLTWAIECDDGLFDILSYEVHITEASQSNPRS
jgi:hypothetical protein